MFTPGPWYLDHGNYLLSVMSHNRERPITNFFDMNGEIDEEDKANARLIAAAPTMYEYIEQKANDGDSDAKKILEAIK